jgi:hypothetical protein
MEWLARQGARIYLPVGHSPDVDLIAEAGRKLLRIQVKTCACFVRGRWQVFIATRGGNQSWNGIVKNFDPSRCDFLYVHTMEGRRWFIPSSAIEGRTSILLGGPKYQGFEIECGPPLNAKSGDGLLESPPGTRGSTQAVNGVAL